VKTFWAFVSGASDIFLIVWIGTRFALSRGMENPSAEPRIGDLVQRIGDDVRTITRAEVELAKAQLARSARAAATDGAAVLLGGVVALIGVGMMAVAVAVALAPLIAALWLRLVLMSVVYMASGAVVAGTFARRLERDAAPDLSTATYEARQTLGNIKAGLAR
jgi:hypothetical protein